MSEAQAIRGVIQTYFESMHESDGDKVHVAFHPRARITGYLDGALQEMTVGEFAGFVDSQQPSPAAQGVPVRIDVVALDIAGDTAVARVRDDYLGMTFLDTLSFLREDGNWRIYNKLFHVEGPAA